MVQFASQGTLIEQLLGLPMSDRLAVIEKMTNDEALSVLYDWRVWARPKQIAPPGKWTTWLNMCGRGYGKTRTGAEWTNGKARTSKTGRGALVGQTYSDIVDTMIEGESGILACASPDFRPEFKRAKQRVVWPNGAQAKCFTAEKPRRLRGPQHEFVWGDEIASWQYPREAHDQIMFGLRIGPHPQLLYTTTPKPIELLVELMKEAVICWDLRDAQRGAAILQRSIGVVVSTGSSYENASNLSEEWFNRTIRPYEGTRLGDQEIMARLLTDVPGALWKRELLDQLRVRHIDPLPEFKRIVVACDPAVTSAVTSSETGIIVAAKGINGHAYVLNDRSGRYTPNGWARELVNAYHHFDADRIIAEINNGGELVKLNVHTLDANVAYRGVTASRGKTVRAEPVAALYEQGKVHHVGTFGLLESQMTTYVPDSGLASPDRMDALVWAITDLMLGKQGAFVVVPSGG